MHAQNSDDRPSFATLFSSLQQMVARDDDYSETIDWPQFTVITLELITLRCVYCGLLHVCMYVCMCVCLYVTWCKIEDCFFLIDRVVVTMVVLQANFVRSQCAPQFAMIVMSLFCRVSCVCCIFWKSESHKILMLYWRTPFPFLLCVGSLVDGLCTSILWSSSMNSCWMNNVNEG